MNLVLDIGNTRMKAAIFHEGEMVATRGFEVFSAVEAGQLREEFGEFDCVAVSSTRKRDEGLERILMRVARRVVVVGRDTPVPLAGMENAPKTLGADRLAAAVGALTLFEGKDVLVVDFGTAVTFDSVTAEGEYVYGTISPGARLRFEALNRLTANLPLCELNGDYETGTTEWSIWNGVVNGILYEVEGYMEKKRAEKGEIITIFSGGDAKFFENRIKNTIFAKLDLVFIGLNRIIEYNAVEKDIE